MKILNHSRSKFYIIYIFLLFTFNVTAQNSYLDNTFNTNGYSIIIDVPDHIDCQSSDMAIQTDGKIILVGGGVRVPQQRGDGIIARFKTNGTPDSTFGVNGILVSEIGPLAAAHNSVEIQPDGKLLVSGINTTDLTFYTPQSYTARYNPDGSFDTTFGTDGIVFFPGATTTSYMWQSALQPDGKLLLAGSVSNPGTPEDQLIIRYNSNGTLDESFDSDGYLSTDIAGVYQRANDITVQADGKIVTGGYHLSDQGMDFLVMRYNPDGSIDSSFATNGHAIIDLVGSNEECRSVAIQPDGKIIALGQTGGTTGQDYRFVVMRFNNDGSLDQNFNGNGIVDAGINDHGEVYTAGIGFRADGKIVFGGSAELNESFTKKFTVLQLNPDGSRDQSFGTDGFVQVSISDLPDDERMMMLDSEGKILLAGINQYLNNFVIAIARILPELILGTLNLNNKNEVLIYPNPLQSSETLTYNSMKDETVSIGLYDLQGKLIHLIMENQKLIAGKHPIPFSIPRELNSGVYFIRIVSPTGEISIKVIK